MRINPGKVLRITLVLGHQLPFPPLQGGGVNNLVWMLARRFRQMGHKVVVCSPLAEGLRDLETDVHGIHHRRFKGARMRRGVWANNLAGLPYALRLWPNLPCSDITSFHAPFSFALRYRKDIGVATHTIHRTPKWILRFYSKMDRIYAGSTATVSEACAIAPMISDRIKAIHNCIELSEAEPAVASNARRSMAMLYVGRFAEDKGLRALIEGGVEAMRSGCEVDMTTIGPQQDDEGGESSFFDEMVGFVRQSGFKDCFRFLPSVTDRASLFSHIDEHEVFCLPSISGETFSMAGLEAMSRARPILASNYGPNAEMVVDGLSGFIAEAGHREAWAAAILKLTKCRDVLPEMGMASWRRARQNFSVETIADQYISDFRELIAARRSSNDV